MKKDKGEAGVFTRADIKRAMSLSPDSDQGKIYSLIFEAVLVELQEEGLIISYRQTMRYSKEDVDGVDFFINVRARTVPFSITGGILEKKDRVKRHSDIPCLSILDQPNGVKSDVKDKKTKSAEQLKTEIMYLVNQYLRTERKDSLKKKK